MATLLLNLRHVPDDEADEVRALLDEHGIVFYETRPSLWGVSAGGLWLKDDARVAEAREVLAAYQHRRGETARAERETARREGRGDSTWAGFLRSPLQFAAAVVGIALMLLVVLLPFLLLR